MNTKISSIVSYFTLVGWIIAYLNFYKGKKSALLQYHLKQSFGFVLLGTLYSALLWICAITAPAIAGILAWTAILYFILLIFGMINALNETQTPVPMIGCFFENRFSFIK